MCAFMEAVIHVTQNLPCDLDIFVQGRERRRKESRIRQKKSHYNTLSFKNCPKTPFAQAAVGTVHFVTIRVHLSIVTVSKIHLARYLTNQNM